MACEWNFAASFDKALSHVPAVVRDVEIAKVPITIFKSNLMSCLLDAYIKAAP